MADVKSYLRKPESISREDLPPTTVSRQVVKATISREVSASEAASPAIIVTQVYSTSAECFLRLAAPSIAPRLSFQWSRPPKLWLTFLESHCSRRPSSSMTVPNSSATGPQLWAPYHFPHTTSNDYMFSVTSPSWVRHSVTFQSIHWAQMPQRDAG